MLVELKASWFAPTHIKAIDQGVRSTSGKRYRKGVQEIPDNLLPYLPKTAKILEAPPAPAPAVDQTKTLKEVDDSRAASDQEIELVAEAEEQAKRNRVERAKRKAKE